MLLRPVMRAIATAVGPHCEVALHDVSRGDVEHTIVAIENGHVTGRAEGGPSSSLGLELLGSKGEGEDDFGYRARTRDGRDLRSSSVYIRNSTGRIVAMLCVNVDLTPAQAAQVALAELLGDDGARRERSEVFAQDVEELLETLVESAIAETGKSVALMDREDRIAVLRYLDAKGAFVIKRAVERVARRLQISRGAAYSYIERIRAEG